MLLEPEFHADPATKDLALAHDGREVADRGGRQRLVGADVFDPGQRPRLIGAPGVHEQCGPPGPGN